MKLTAQDAHQLAREYHELARRVGDYRFDHYETLTPRKRKDLEDLQWDLLTYSTIMDSTASGILLDEAEGGLDAVLRATRKATTAIKKIDDVRNVLKVGVKLSELAGAFISRDPKSIFKKSKELKEQIERMRA